MKKVWKNIGMVITGMILGAVLVNKAHGKVIDEMKENGRKNLFNFQLMNNLYKAAQNGLDFNAYFNENGYNRIAIYGASYVGERFMKELEKTEVHVEYMIDKRAEKLQSSVHIYTLEERLPEVDAVIVTSAFFYHEIKQELSNKVRCSIVSIEDILANDDLDKRE